MSPIRTLSYKGFPATIYYTIGSYSNIGEYLSRYSMLELHDTSSVGDIASMPLSRRLDRCDRVIQNESGDYGGNV